MTDAAPKRQHILLTPDQAAQVRGLSSPGFELDPRLLPDGNYILGVGVLDDPGHAKHIPFLMTLPHCELKIHPDGDIEMVGKPALPRTKPPKPVKTRDGNAWGIPVLPDKGDWNDERLYASIGRALSEWESFERGLASLFQSLLSPTLYALPAERAYGSVVNFKNRADMVRAAGDAYFAGHPTANPKMDDGSGFDPAAAELEFERIMALAVNLSNRRNEIAHGIVGQYSTPAGPTKGLALQPSDAANKGRPLPVDALKAGRWAPTKPTYAYTSREIDHFAALFGAIKRETYTLSYRIHRHFVFEEEG